ncbi:hypothetical protein NUZ5A_50561 [Candidatus Nitrosotenuis uzonensis]|uniref:Uncharacterized protein n=1 Tax=Candidatus Nitrosotenuis uzonensis TaxID=1407055 RepID=A0A812EZS2_9ARCH|nr:hypothetical protein NUZ5A_50561 [Candidatus Nitrosotenuis uzonensis]
MLYSYYQSFTLSDTIQQKNPVCALSTTKAAIHMHNLSMHYTNLRQLRIPEVDVLNNFT